MKPVNIHPQQERENPEPVEGSNPIPWIVIVLTGLLLLFGAVYIARSSLGDPPSMGDGRTAIDLQGATPVIAGAKVDGAAVYSSRCMACHQASGAGLPGVFPPLAGSEWVAGKDTTLVALVLHGSSGSLTVRGNVFNGAMPAFGSQLQDAELAAVLTHLRSSWGNTGAPVTAETVAAVRKDTSARTEPFKGDSELNALK